MTTVDDARLAYVALSLLVEQGNRDLGIEVAEHGPVATLDRMVAGRVRAQLYGAAAARLRTGPPLRSAQQAVEHAERMGARIITPLDDEWPAQLADLATISRDTAHRIDRDTYPPLCLWVRGPWELAQILGSSVAVVGARAASPYGNHAATELAYGVADRGWTVVSGGAVGIDAAAHRGALTAGRPTVAVLACGLDRPYPVSNSGLFERVAEDGLLVTEWPPGSLPHRHRFLVRNRVIAAATRGTVVVEAAVRSGAVQTLHRAIQLGRTAMAVPGPVSSAMSVGCHEALRTEGTRLVTGASHVLEEVGSIGVDLAATPRGPVYDHDRLDAKTAQVLDAVPARQAAGPEEIAAAAGVALTDALYALSELVAAGFAIAKDGGYALAPPPKRSAA